MSQQPPDGEVVTLVGYVTSVNAAKEATPRHFLHAGSATYRFSSDPPSDLPRGPDHPVRVRGCLRADGVLTTLDVHEIRELRRSREASSLRPDADEPRRG